jgi:DNA repair exonuclease SbcCD ATPase subunit
VHEDIDRSNNEVRVANICQWNVNKKIPDLLKEIEKYFEISPPENSPELQKLISDIVRINKSIATLKNFNYASFNHSLLNDQQLALNNGDYNCLRSSQEYLAVKEQMFDVSQNLRKMKMEVLSLQEEVKEMSEDKKEAIEKFHEKVREYEQVKMNFKDLTMKYDADNIKKFLQDQVNKLMYEQESLKEKMLECDADSLPNLQDDYLRLTKNMTKYVTLMEKGFAY